MLDRIKRSKVQVKNEEATMKFKELNIEKHNTESVNNKLRSEIGNN